SFILVLYFPAFFFHGPPTSESSPLSLHDALPISSSRGALSSSSADGSLGGAGKVEAAAGLCSWPASSSSSSSAASSGSRMRCVRSEEHTSELQSRENLVCRLLLEKKKKTSK